MPVWCLSMLHLAYFAPNTGSNGENAEATWEKWLKRTRITDGGICRKTRQSAGGFSRKGHAALSKASGAIQPIIENAHLTVIRGWRWGRFKKRVWGTGDTLIIRAEAMRISVEYSWWRPGWHLAYVAEQKAVAEIEQENAAARMEQERIERLRMAEIGRSPRQLP